MTTKSDLKTTGKVLAGLLFSTLAASAQAPPPRAVTSSAMSGENAAATITMDVAAYANLQGEWKYRRTENGTIDVWSRKILGIKTERTNAVVLLQEYDEDGDPNDQVFFDTDLSNGLYEAGGTNDYGQSTQEKFYWQPLLPALMKSFVPGKVYTDQYTQTRYPGTAKMTVGFSIKTEAKTLAVPFGTFDCYKVTRIATVAGEVVHQESSWYARNIGLIKRDSDSSLWELISYQHIPEINVEQPAGTRLVDGTAKKSFGTVTVGMTGTAKTFTIKNTGTANLTGLAITKDGANAKDFIVTAPAKTTLASGTSATFSVRFKPNATGIRNAAIHIKNNDADENPFDIKLTGMGAAP